MEKFCIEILPRCRWRLLPFGFLYDLYEAWFPSVGLYEKPQTKKVFVERIILFLKDDPNWTVEDKYLAVDENNMPMPEPLIVQYNLKNWMNKNYAGDDIAIICSPEVHVRYKGIYRNDRHTT